MNIFAMTQSASLAGRIFDSKTPTEPMITYRSYKPAFVFERHSTKLKRATPEEVGISSAYIREFISKIASDKTLNMHNLLIIKDGKLICEAVFGAQRLDIWKHTFSACKSITSLAIGMLIDDGALALNDRVVSVFPGEIGAIAKIRLKDLTVEDLLTMRSSVLFAEVESATDEKWIREFFSSTTDGEIGETFRYNSLNTYILSAIVLQKTGKGLSQFLEERLFRPLGIADYYWEKSPEEIEKGGWGLYIYPEDLAKLGILVMNGGVYDGKRLISEEYIQDAISQHVKVTEDECLFDYGYQIWVGNDVDSFLFNGMLGQNVLGFRKNDVLLVTHAGNSEFFQSSSYFKYALEFFGRDFLHVLPKNRRAESILNKTVSGLSLYQSKGFWHRFFNLYRRKRTFDLLKGEYTVKKGDHASIGVMPLILQMVQSEYTKGFESISLDYENEAPCIRYCEKDCIHTFILGFDSPIVESHCFGSNTFWVANTASLKQNEDNNWVLTVRLDFLETPSSRIIKIIFGDNVLLKQEEIPGEEFAADLTEAVLKKITDKPIVSAFLDKIGDDYIELKLKKAFSPEIVLQEKSDKI